MGNNNYSSDTPVFSKEEDRFSRWSFSERVAEVISKRSDPGCITIGLYGAWGDGKTSVLNFIEDALEGSDNVIFIKFNPWRFTTEDALLTGFFLKIAESIDAELIKTGDKLKDFIKKVAPGVGAVVGAKGAGDSISSFIGGPDIDELKVRVEAELESAKKRVLIVIDDVDRLEKSEIQSLFKLIKLTADFRYTAYILAFDKDIVSASLQDRYSGGSNNSGEAFLEKIIQVPLHLPKVERKVLREFCFKGVDEALSISEIDLTEQQVQEFVRDFTYAFDECLSTPRRAKLYGNTLMFSLPILRGEVNPVDLMLIEGIRVFCPPLYDVIRNNKSMLTGLFRDSTYTNHDEAKGRIKTIIDDALNTGGINDKPGFVQVMKSLFPKLESVYGNMNYGDDFYEIWNKGQRVCSENYFNRYFTYSIPRGDIGDNAIQDMINQLEQANLSSDGVADSEIFSGFISSDNAESVIKKLRQKADGLTKAQSLPLAKSICLECKSYPNPDVLYNWTAPFIQAGMLVNQLISAHP
ncbi:P-loop NTPase fold protein [Pseudomonadota bacterium]